MGMFAVCAGVEEMDLVEGYKAAGDDYNAILLQAVGDRLAEAMAEYLHFELRTRIGLHARGIQQPRVNQRKLCRHSPCTGLSKLP